MIQKQKEMQLTSKCLSLLPHDSLLALLRYLTNCVRSYSQAFGGRLRAIDYTRIKQKEQFREVRYEQAGGAHLPGLQKSSKERTTGKGDQ